MENLTRCALTSFFMSPDYSLLFHLLEHRLRSMPAPCEAVASLLEGWWSMTIVKTERSNCIGRKSLQQGGQGNREGVTFPSTREQFNGSGKTKSYLCEFRPQSSSPRLLRNKTENRVTIFKCQNFQYRMLSGFDTLCVRDWRRRAF